MDGQTQPVERARIGAFEVNFSQGELRKNGIRLKIHDQPLEILALLVSRPGELVTREEIRQRLWRSGTFVDFDNGLNSAVNRLRTVFGDSAESPKFIETIPRRGYRFIAAVERSEAPPVTRIVEQSAPRGLSGAQGFDYQRWLWAGTVAFAALLVAAAMTFLGFRYFKSQPATALNFQARDWALVTQFENRTGEPVLDGTVDAALARDLTNSQFVTVVPRERINDTLTLMRLPKDTAVDASVGREVCLRDGGIRVLIAGRVEKVGSAYVLSAQLVDPANGRVAESFEQDANSESGILRAVHLLSNDVRHALGQKLPEIRQSDLELQKVTTPSLRALQLYSRADEQVRDGNLPAAFELLRNAINEDPNFASAYILAAYALAKQGKPSAEFLPYAKKALELSRQASDAERYFIEGSYYEMTNQRERAAPAYEALLKINPGHFWGLNNLQNLYYDLSLQYASQNRMQELVDLSVHSADIEPNNFKANFGAGFVLLLVSERPDLAQQHFDHAAGLLAEMSSRDRANYVWEALWLQLYPAYQAWMMDDVGLARADLERAERNPAARDGLTDPVIFAAFRQTLGETHKAEAWLVKAFPPPEEGDALTFAMLTFVGGDHTATRSWLKRVERNENQPRIMSPMAISLFVREGMVHQADSLARKYNQWRPQFRNIAMGELLLAQGKTALATRLLRDGVNEERDHAYPTYFLGAESLARAYERNGNFSAALDVLQSTSTDRARVDGPFGMSAAPLWMQDQIDLAGLYRRLNRAKDAEKIEDELRKLLTYADSDYPMLVDLERRRSNSLPARSLKRATAKPVFRHKFRKRADY